MGCDYYIYTYLVITYIGNDEKEYVKEVEIDKQAGYICNDYDSDFETIHDYLNRLDANRGEKYIYKNQLWLCIDSKKDEYLKFVEKSCNDMKLLVSISKIKESILR